MMKKIRNILFATDISESSVPACDYALTLANLAGAALRVLHLIDEFADKRKSQIQPEAMALREREVEVQALKEMKTFCADKFDELLDYTTEVVIGIPFEEILKRAETLAADLIVVGVHGRTGLEHVIVGSIAERLVRRSKIPVLTVLSQA